METLTADVTRPVTPSWRASVPNWLPEGTLALGCALAADPAEQCHDHIPIQQMLVDA